MGYSFLSYVELLSQGISEPSVVIKPKDSGCYPPPPAIKILDVRTPFISVMTDAHSDLCVYFLASKRSPRHTLSAWFM